MPVALETSKRKFNTLLDNLTAASSPPSDASSAARPSNLDGSPSSKRTRVTLRAVASNQNGVASARIKGRPVVSSGNEATSQAPAADRSPPNYTPWSHELFLERLRTFAELSRWTPKPDAVNEVQWARRGWVCEGVNTVACRGGCEQRVVVGLRPARTGEGDGEIEGSEDYSIEVDEELVRRYAELIVTAHGENCLWRAAGCKDDIYRLPIARPTIWQPKLRERYESFKKIGKLPSAETLGGLSDLKALQECLTADFFPSESPGDNKHAVIELTVEDKENHDVTTGERSSTNARQVDSVAFAFAMYGWHGSDQGSGNTIATCEACFRRIGLWLYEKGPPSIVAEGSNGSQPMELDLVENHRDYCPWVNAKSQSMVGAFAGLAGWEILQRVVLNSANRTTEKSLSSLSQEDGSLGQDYQSTLKAKDAEKSDKIRFARLKELTKAMSFKSLRNKSNKVKTTS